MIYKKRKNFIVLQAVVFLIGLLMSYTTDLSSEYKFILAYSIFNLLSYGWLFIQEMKYAPDFHPYQVLALISAQFIGMNGISIYTDLAKGETHYFGASPINHCLYLGILFLALQHLILFAVFFVFERKHSKENEIKFADRIMRSRIGYGKWAIRSYVAVWVVRGLSFFISLGSISALLVNFANFGHLLTLYLIVFAMIKSPDSTRYKNIHWIIVALEIVLVINHGMKEEIIRTLVPYCMYLLIMYKAGYQKINSRMITSIFLVGSFVVGFVFPYVSITRSISLRTGNLWSEIPVSQVFDEYLMYVGKEGVYAHDDEKRGAGYLMSRAGSIACNAWSVDHARTEGTEPLYLAYCASAMIPRIIWRDKPKVVTGAIAYSMVNGESNWANTTVDEEQATSISLGFVGSCYLCLGLVGGIMYMCFISWFIWFVWNVCRKKMTYNFIILWAFISFVAVLLKDFEGFHDCGINFLVFNLIYIILCEFVVKMNNSRITANEL